MGGISVPRVHRPVVLALVALAVAACGFTPPPSPTESLRPSIVGVTTREDPGSRWLLADGGRFDPPSGASVRELRNLPDSVQATRVGSLLLGGLATDGSWWFELAEPALPGSWCISGGAWDEGTAIHFSDGLLVPKGPHFRILGAIDGQDPFPARGYDQICLDAEGHALRLEKNPTV